MASIADLVADAVQRLVDDPTYEPTHDEIATAVAPEPTGARLSIGEVSARLGVSAHTLRFYEKEGLISVPRAASGIREYDDAAVGRVWFLTALRACGLSIADLRRYLALEDEEAPCAGGVGAGEAESARAERVVLLTEHREALHRRLAELRLALAITDYKLALCAERAGAATARRTA